MATRPQSRGSNPQEQQKGTHPLIINPALGGFAGATGKVAKPCDELSLWLSKRSLKRVQRRRGARCLVSYRATSRMGAAYTVQVQTVLMGPKRNHFLPQKTYTHRTFSDDTHAEDPGMTREQALEIVIAVAQQWGENTEEGLSGRRINPSDTDEYLREEYDVDFEQAVSVRDLWRAIGVLQQHGS